MGWIDRSGDRDRDGFQEYETRSTHGYYNQGWKDAGDAIPHEDGSLAPLPLALCELQGYVYDAKLRMADLYERHRPPEGRQAAAGRRPRTLYDRFNDAFWWEAEGTYYLGLDGQKRPIRTVASNAGHLLQSGIVPPERAGRVVERLLRRRHVVGLGDPDAVVRPRRLQPVLVPHGHGLAARQRDDRGRLPALRLCGRGGAGRGRAVRRARRGSPAHRLPELFAGLPRHEASFPVQYLGANVPQAWAASAILRFVAVMAGIHARTEDGKGRLYVDPALPTWLPDLSFSNLRAGRGAVSLDLVDGELRVGANTTGFEVVHGAAAARDRPRLSGVRFRPRLAPPAPSVRAHGPRVAAHQLRGPAIRRPQPATDGVSGTHAPSAPIARLALTTCVVWRRTGPYPWRTTHGRRVRERPRHRE